MGGHFIPAADTESGPQPDRRYVTSMRYVCIGENLLVGCVSLFLRIPSIYEVSHSRRVVIVVTFNQHRFLE